MDIKKNWRHTLLSIESTIQDVIRNLNESALQISLVISQEGKLQGTITDGDIRRALLRGLTIDSPIDTVIHRNALVAPVDMQREVVLQLLKANKIHQLPIVDAEHHVVGLHLIDELSKPVVRNNLMVIMSGGMGVRLRPFTEQCPKPLLEVAGKPMLEHIVERAKAEGFTDFLLAIHYLGHMIEDYFGHGALWDVHIDYLREQFPLGTAGALSLLQPIPSQAFLVSNGDVLTDIRYSEMLDYHCQQNAVATMAVRLHEWTHPFGVVETKGVQITGFEEKPVTRTYVNAGIYVLEPSVLSFLKSDEPCDMPTLFERLRQNGLHTVVYPIHEPWLDVGAPADFDRAQQHEIKKSLEKQRE